MPITDPDHVKDAGNTKGWSDARNETPAPVSPRSTDDSIPEVLDTLTRARRGFLPCGQSSPGHPLCYAAIMDHRHRQHRPRGFNDPGHAHELTFSCFHRYPFLSRDRTCQWLAEAIDAARRQLDYAVWAYVFMPDHVHLIVCPRRPAHDTSEFLKALKEPVSRRAVRYLRDNSPDWLPRIRVTRGERIEHRFWQPGRGYDRNITSARTLQSMIDYIHLNPVRRGLVETVASWKWSSASWFAGCPLNDLKPDPIPFDWLEVVD